MLRYLERKYPKRKRLIEWIDFGIDAFWIILVLLLLINVKNYCSPELICGECYEPIEIDWEQLEVINFSVVNFTEKGMSYNFDVIRFEKINETCYKYMNYS